MGRLRLVLAVLLLGAVAAVYGQDVTLRAPSGAVAGTATSISTTGSGSATFYLVGPAIALKKSVPLGQDVSLSPKELQAAGRYLAIVCTGSCSSVGFFVAPAKPSTLAFLVHPSRAPVGQGEFISGVALPFDEFHNMVLTPETINFQMAMKGSNPASQKVQTQNGVAWFRSRPGKSAGPLQLEVALNDVTTRRVVQQVASDPCQLRIKGERTPKGIEIETEPVRDCAGNPVPDGTIVTFTARSGNVTDTVDAPVKQDVARARITANGPVVISAASGVVMGNELRLGGQ